jgi:hypothetical protein
MSVEGERSGGAAIKQKCQVEINIHYIFSFILKSIQQSSFS